MKYTEALELAESLGINPAWFENPDSLIFAVELAQENLKMMQKMSAALKERSKQQPPDPPPVPPKPSSNFVINKRSYKRHK